MFELGEMKLSEFKAALKLWEETTALDIKEKEEAAKQIKENEWECDHCHAINTWAVDDPESCKCRRCGCKNDNIAEMIIIMGNKRHIYEE